MDRAPCSTQGLSSLLDLVLREHLFMLCSGLAIKAVKTQ